MFAMSLEAGKCRRGIALMGNDVRDVNVCDRSRLPLEGSW